MATDYTEKGKTDLTAAATYASGSTPGDGDNVIIRNNNLNMTGDLTIASLGNAAALSLIELRNSLVGQFGTEQTPIAIDADRLVIGVDDTGRTKHGSRLINIDLGSLTQCDVEIHSSSLTPYDPNFPTIRIHGNRSDHTVKVIGPCRLGMSFLPGETDQISKIEIADNIDAVVTLGEGLTVANIEGGGEIHQHCTVTSQVIANQRLYTYGLLNLPTLYAFGQCWLEHVRASGTYDVTTLEIGSRGVVNMSRTLTQALGTLRRRS